MTDGKPKVLVKEKIAESGVELLRNDFEVELGLEMSDGELDERIGEFDGIVIRSQTRLTAELIERGSRLKVIGRAGTGVDNVDVSAATKRGIVVVNAPESNAVAAAEHTLALALALCRNVPQAHSSLVGGDWARSRFAGNELYGKTLGVIGFGRIGQLVAHRAQAFEMEVVAFDKFVAAERFRELGVERAETSEELYAEADIVTIHLPKTPDTIDWIDAEAIAQMKDGVRIVNCARGELVDLEAARGGTRIGQGRRGGARRLPQGAGHGPPAVRARQRRRHPPPGCGHRGGAGPRRDDHRRSGAPRSLRRRGDQRGQHRGRPPRGDGGAGSLRAAVREARPPGPGPRQRLGRPDRGRVPRPDRRARHPAARHCRPGGDPLGPHRGTGQSRQRPRPGRGARHRAERAQGHRLG